MIGRDRFHDARGGAPGPDDLCLAWDAAERYAVALLREALPQVQAVPAPAEELSVAAARFRSAVRKWPYRYARQCPEITSATGPGDEGEAYDPFAGGVTDDESLCRGFEVALLSWEAIGAVSEQRWLTRLGWWGLPRALARAWRGDLDGTTWVDTAELDGKGGSWPGQAPSLAELGIREPPVAS